MCGIAGVFNYCCQDRRVDRPIVEAMTRALAHRGPNGEGVMIDGPIGLGHRRLAIVDLSETGAQPMSNPERTLWISYNGEFYNHAGFRRELASRQAFRGTSDTETLLRLFEERGAACFPDVMGIFGVAFWDKRRRRLTLARDHLGVKQLYYYDDGERLLFASEIKALLATGLVPRELDVEAVNQYLHFHTPLFERTFFRHVRQLRAGEYMEVDEVGPRRHTYWTVPTDDEPITSPDAAVQELRAVLDQVVGEQLLSDVPVGAFLSGGIDSSSIAAFAKRAGRPPHCFGVHFSDGSVVDERPFQEETARALGLELDLITLDGSSFPDDLARLLRFQDQPVIGAAMLPMYYVSKLAASQVRVCLGGQAADEIFGGYARYGLAAPLTVARSWLSGQAAAADRESGLPSVGGNLRRQLLDPLTLGRLAHSLHPSWARRYFNHFAKVSEAEWRHVISAEEIVSRESCWQTYVETIARSPSQTPPERVMLWDVQTYLPGLFQQDDRMSMSNGLESRVPFADPRLVRLAFRIPFDLKFRAGASKWVLRQAIADVIPPRVLSRRKVGFDTPAALWMRGRHQGFVRDVLLDRRALERGIWSRKGIEGLLAQSRSQHWFDIAWKVLCIEVWARELLDPPAALDHLSSAINVVSDTSAPADTPEPEYVEKALQVVDEVRALKPAEFAFRVGWELGLRTGVTRVLEPAPSRLGSASHHAQALPPTLPFGHGACVRAFMEERLDTAARRNLQHVAEQAVRGRLLCFKRWLADYGDPIDWHVNPQNGRRWNPEQHWSQVLRDEPRVGDVKLTWEIARFPQAYYMARAATLLPELREDMANGLAAQIASFVKDNPYGHGIHWVSGQEIAIRAFAWLFGISVLGGEAAIDGVDPAATDSMYEAGCHIRRYINYARKAVYNNHLIAEGLGLLTLGSVLPNVREADAWRREGESLLDECAVRQFKSDGAYIQNSHNYHRAALLFYLWGAALMRNAGRPLPSPWRLAMEHSVDFLHAHQNPGDGRLPNYGGNDGAMPLVLSTCDFSDFRPALQAASVAARGERLYPPGPWDEVAAWISTPTAVESAPLRAVGRVSVSFGESGYHVLRGRDPSTFATLRCGDIVERFSQIDMLALDVWWRGQNVIADAGSYLYNGPARWHDHFLRTSGHSTVQVDDIDQMLHHRRFKVLYWTKARLLRFEDGSAWCLAEGEHHGFERGLPGCVHRRSVLLLKDRECIVVVDTIGGSGEHDVKLQWLAGATEYAFDPGNCLLRLNTPAGPFFVKVVDARALPASADVACGRPLPPRGWLSRYYGEKVAVPSLHAGGRLRLPATLVTVLSPAEPLVSVRDGAWLVDVGGQPLAFTLRDGRFDSIGSDEEASLKAVAIPS